MDPLITNGVDPALLRVFEKRGHERDESTKRRRMPAPAPPRDESEAEAESNSPKHELDDLA